MIQKVINTHNSIGQCMVHIYEKLKVDFGNHICATKIQDEYTVRIKPMLELQRIYGDNLYWSGHGGRVPEQLHIIDLAQELSEYSVIFDNIDAFGEGPSLVQLTVLGVNYDNHSYTWPMAIFMCSPKEGTIGVLSSASEVNLKGLKKDFK